MARRKRVISQRDMRLMEVREDFLGRTDSDMLKLALKGARNMRSLATGAIEARPGTAFRANVPLTANKLVEYKPDEDTTFGIYVTDSSLVVFDHSGAAIKTFAAVPWSSAEGVYVTPIGPTVLIGGSFGIYYIRYDDGEWEGGSWSFADSTGGEIAQPYWAFNPKVKIQPSGKTGTITITATEDVFTASHVGTRIRYLNREIAITEFIAANTLKGTVINELPPSYRLSITDSSGFRVGDAVIGNDSNWQGRVTAVYKASGGLFSKDTLEVVTLHRFEGPETGATIAEELSGPNTSSKLIAGGKTEIAPQPTDVWDEQMMSAAHGWPRAAAVAGQRLFFTDFPEVPSAIAVSSARGFDDFDVGLEDDDAILREIGDGKPRLKHVVNSGDLLIFSDKGSYVVFLREQVAITPSNFSPILFDDRGASDVKPVRVNDGVVFVESNNEQVSAAVLSGNVQLRWQVRSLTAASNHLINSPVNLCGPAVESATPEKYLLIVNSDGTLAALSYNESLDEQVIGAAPWDTQGEFVDVAPVFGKYWALVDRTIDGNPVRYLETFEDGFLVDCGMEVETLGNSYDQLETNGSGFEVNGNPLYVGVPHAIRLAGKDVYIVEGSRIQGPFTVNSDGTITDLPDIIGTRQIGLNFQAEVRPWPAEMLDSARAGTFDERCITFIVAVQNSGEFTAQANNDSRPLGGYDFGDILGEAPPLRTKEYRIPVFGRRTYPELAVVKEKPAKLRVLYLAQEVQG